MNHYLPVTVDDNSEYHRKNILCLPTIKPDTLAQSWKDSELLMTAMGGYGLDENLIVKILTHRNSKQREEIKKECMERYKTCLIDLSIKTLSDPLQYLALCLLHTGPRADAYIINQAFQDSGTGVSRLIHILCTRSSDVSRFIIEQISKIKESYEKMFKMHLADKINLDTSGKFRNVLLYLINNPRMVAPANHKVASEQAFMVYSKSYVGLSCSEELIPIFCQSSYDQIKAIDDSFNKSIERHLEKYSGTYEATLRTIIQFSTNPTAYYASYLKSSISNSLIRDVICMIATRFEIDLASILNEYCHLYISKPEIDIRNNLNLPAPIISAVQMLFGLE
ncbi:Annexin A7 [Thelohanellus kitauei]|uniref:Annexin A7 n=1 Tax=Thelohanellus kitauei TaxID=669202 RepID=A0A0C2N664_THEKT|nr:Annexin A7 [Thelohanellus kitauei]